MEEYDYKKQPRLGYGQIRLLKLHPGSGTTDLKCNLVPYSIRTSLHVNSAESGSTPNQLEPYDALSYHWGPKRRGFFVEVLAGSDAYRISITPNLDGALRHLRSATAHKFLWVDALCINQGDEDEKSSQIPKMSQIYNGADHVRVWLGLEEGHSAKAMEFVKKCLDLDDFDRLVRDSFASKEWAALSALMRRPWFNRRWIIQEIALAKSATLHCGKDSVPWRDFADALSLLECKQYEIRQLFRESTTFRNHPDYIGDLSELGAIRLVYAADNLFRKSEDGQIMEHLLSLEALMSSLSAFEASEPRDTVYAILWLANDARPAARDAFVMDSRNLSPPSPTYTATTAGQLSPPYARSSRESLQERNTPSTHIRRTSFASRTQEVRFGNLDPPRRLSVTTTPAIQINGEDEPATNGAASATQPDGVDKATDCHERENLPLPATDDTKGQRVSLERSTSGEDVLKESANLFSCAARPRKLSLSIDPSQNTTESAIERNKTVAAATMLMNALESRRITVDYRKDVFHVCKDFLGFIVTRSNSLDMICRPWAPEYLGLPSWIPRLSGSAFGLGVNGVYRRVNADPLVGRPGLDTKRYRAAKSRRAFWRPKEGQEKSLLVEGFILSTIKEKKSAATAGIIPSEWLDAGGWSKPDDPNQPVPDHFWRLLVGNRDANGKRPPSHWHRVCRDAFNRRPARGDLNTGEVIMYDCPSATREFLERVQCMVWSRRLVVLGKLPHRQGRPSPPPTLGLAPSKAKKGDLICILFGCSVPVVLRKFVDGKPASKQTGCERCQYDDRRHGQVFRDAILSPEAASVAPKPHVRYEFIGECYVHGMMDGEAFEVQKRAKIPDQEFELV
ncbi:hypothetical protein H2201_004068 [Coniosporium apollinis]|uniref:Heterokaryon incompatibility domain-containing protein n=1 Tax=Coniosporium apollinis TaxID=61459 RepID=A0ABQ9NTK2_9PEZI|nr:hypothetical protein H2201_004068 [Coniosporium apollinis]